MLKHIPETSSWTHLNVQSQLTIYALHGLSYGDRLVFEQVMETRMTSRLG